MTFPLYNYLDKIEMGLEYLPIDLYFIQERISNDDSSRTNSDVLDYSNVDIVPNILTKIDYLGSFIAVPTHPLSQILNHEKFINIENISK